MGKQKIASLSVFFVLCAGLVFAQEPLNALNQDYISGIQASYQTVSQKNGLAGTIDRILDCAANGRITIALIGLNEVPGWVLRVWQHDEPEIAEVSISRYSMALNAKNTADRSESFRFRTQRPDGTIAELLVLNVQPTKQAVRIFSFVNAAPTGPHQTLQNTLQELLATVEEGSITVSHSSLSECPQGVVTAWKKCSTADFSEVSVRKFKTDNSGGEDVFWRVSHETHDGAFQQSMLIHRNQIVFSNINGKIDTF
jgi:hypothetical protein